MVFITMMIVFISCDKGDPSPNVDWNAFKIGLINEDNDIIRKEISKLLINTNPNTTGTDLIGQRLNIDKLVSEINKSEILIADCFCYACIETYPAQSEIKITTDSARILVSHIIDILTPKDNILSYAGIHDTY